MEIGKRVFDDLYIHLSALEHLSQADHRQLICDALKCIGVVSGAQPNIAKLNLKSGRLSLLAYPRFDEDAFPELAASWAFKPSSTSPAFRTYTDSLNPPILHRKESLVAPAYPQRETWATLTATAESLGLFDDTRTIGFRLNWERLIESKGYQLTGGEFRPLGNAEPTQAAEHDGNLEGTVQRHLTALTRTSVSAPVQLLLRHGLLYPAATFFDYGCGRGGDVSALGAESFEAHGWDPHYAPSNEIVAADVVNLGFVINVIEDSAERVDAMSKAFQLARRVMSVGVMLYGNENPGRPFRDGFLSTRNTFQKYFTQGELKDYIEHVLHQEAFMVGPGVAFVFADRELEQRFNASRFRSRGIAARLLAAHRPRVPATDRRTSNANRPPRRSRSEIAFEQARPILDSLWKTTLELGRFPDSEEVSNLTEISSAIGGFAKAIRLLSRRYDLNVLKLARQTREDDLRLFLAAQQFSKRPAYRQLEPRLRRDIKAFFGDYHSAQSAGMRLLFNAADPRQLFAACVQAASQGLGWLEGQHSLQLHVSLVDRLPVVLRAYIACGLILWDSISEVQLVKIHITSGKLTLLEFDDFDASALPTLKRRIKLNVRDQDYDLFEYGSAAFPKPLLYRKSRYLHEDQHGFAEQLAFDEALDNTGILGDSDFGPSSDQLNGLLEMRRLSIRGVNLVPSERIPDLDEPCGNHLTYRAFIECGETQKKSGIKNLPVNPATYNALHDLATKILDPLIEYFGEIELTYGFCSAKLARQIPGRIAPKLDQHAAHECNRHGTLICDRLGAAVDFLVPDENMRDVADWVLSNTPCDRIYFYGPDRPIHVSWAPVSSKQLIAMELIGTRRRVPRRLM